MLIRKEWTDRRLNKLFAFYNRKYWDGQLKSFAVTGCNVRTLRARGAMGSCDSVNKLIMVDIPAHKNEKELRATLLHEMAHAASGKDTIAHGYQFWAQIEMLLQKQAPISVDNPEAPNHANFVDIIPKKFPLSRLAMQAAEARRTRKVLQLTQDMEVVEIDDDYIVSRFEDAAFSNLSWQAALWAVSSEVGLLDVGGKPKNNWAGRVIIKGRKAYKRKMRLFSGYRRN